MAGVSFAAGQPFYDNVLTDFYLPVFADARNNSAVLWGLLPRGKRRVAGKFIKFPVRTTRNHGGNAIFPGGDLPTAGHQGAETYAFKYRHYYQAIQVDGATIDAADMDAASYADILDTEVNGAFDDIVVDQNRMLHNDGSGRRAEITTVVNGTTLDLEVNSNIVGAANCPTAPTRFIEVGMTLMACTAAGATPISMTVASIVSDTRITVDDTTGAAVGDWLVSSSNGTTTTLDDGSFRAEPMGIAGIMSDTGVFDGNGLSSNGLTDSGQIGSDDRTTTAIVNVGFQGIDADSSHEFNQAIVNSASSTRPISEALLQQVLSDAEEKNNAMIDVLLSSYSTYNSYFDVLKGDKRYNNTLELTGGHKVLTFNGIGFIKDRHTYGGRVYGLGLDQFYLYEVVPLQWVDQDGLKFRKVDSKDDWKAELKTRYTVGVDVRQRAGFVLSDLSS